MNPKKIIQTSMVAAGVFLLLFSSQNVSAAEATALTTNITVSSGAAVTDMTDDSYKTMTGFNSGDTITISSETPVAGLYIVWNNKTVSPWKLTYNKQTKDCGTAGYLHEYVKLDKTAKNLTMTIEADGMKIARLVVLSEGTLPSWVQDWSAPCDKADILLVSTHADDEQLFFGGILPYYAGEQGLKVQLVYFTNYWNGANIREHEKLDGLWTVGVHNYPVNGDFDDLYAENLEQAKQVYDYGKALSFITEQIRRFKPLVLVGQDLKGEYGHGAHMLTATAITEAIQISNNATSSPESAKTYGTYEVPKTYLHLYPEHQIKLDCQRKLDKFGGKTVLEVAKEGYLRHQSQQWCWFYVSDDYKYSCALFGLYNTKVGTDTGNDLLEHVTTYEEQARIAEEESSKEAASIEASKEAQSKEASMQAATSESIQAAKEQNHREKLHSMFALGTSVTGLFLIGLGILMLLIRAHQKSKKKKQ